MKRTSLLAAAALAMLSLFTTPAVAVVPVPDAAYYKLDDGAGNTVVDSTGNSTSGAWAGDPGANGFAPGLFGSGSQTNDENGGNGQEHYRMTLNGLDGATAATVSLWFNLNSETNNNSTYNGLFMTRDVSFQKEDGSGNNVDAPLTGQNWGLAMRNNGFPYRIDSRVNGHGASNSTDLGGDTWYNAVMTWDGATGQRITYINGVEEDNQTDANDIGHIITGGQWRLSDDACCNSRELTGETDDVAVWTTALDAATVAELYNNGLAGINAGGDLPPKLGDVNLDTLVNGIDFDIIADNFLKFGAGGADRGMGDLTDDGKVDFDDYAQWKIAYDALSGNAVSNAVPEPTTLTLLGLLGCGLASSRLRRS